MAPAVALSQQGLVWRIDTPRGPSYLVGITHMSAEPDWAGGLPAPVREAIHASRSVLFESNVLPIDSTGKVVPQQWVAELPARYPRVTLAEFDSVHGDLRAANRLLLQQLASGRLANPDLPAAVVARLDDEIDRMFPHESAKDRGRVTFLKRSLAATSDAWLLWEIPTALSAAARARAATGPEPRRLRPGLDALVGIESRRTGKRIGTLENYPETLEAIAQELRRDDQVERRLLCLIDESLRPDPDALLAATTHPVYAGDVPGYKAAMEELAHGSVIYREVFYPSSLVRNQRWLPRVEEWMNSDRCPCVFAVGAVHLVEEGSLTDLLRERGYAITRVTSD